MAEEGLEQLWARHQRLSQDLMKELAELGLEPFVEAPEDRLSTVNTIKVRTNSRPELDAICRFLAVSSAQVIDKMHHSSARPGAEQDQIQVPEGVDWQALVKNAMVSHESSYSTLQSRQSLKINSCLQTYLHTCRMSITSKLLGA